jgi:hypothetical protein
LLADIPEFITGAAGFGGSPTAQIKAGGSNMSVTNQTGAFAAKALRDALDAQSKLSTLIGGFDRRQDNWNEAAAEAQTQIEQANVQNRHRGARRSA